MFVIVAGHTQPPVIGHGVVDLPVGLVTAGAFELAEAVSLDGVSEDMEGYESFWEKGFVINDSMFETA